jgi:hypothetical protein
LANVLTVGAGKAENLRDIENYTATINISIITWSILCSKL